MNFETTSTNPVVKAVVEGTAPRPARVAASRGILPLPQSDLLEILVALAHNGDEELSANARETLKNQNQENLGDIVTSPVTAPQVLAYFADEETLPFSIHEAILSNLKHARHGDYQIRAKHQRRQACWSLSRSTSSV